MTSFDSRIWKSALGFTYSLGQSGQKNYCNGQSGQKNYCIIIIFLEVDLFSYIYGLYHNN